ncbi:MAG: c-type cytochrome [Cyclobacteriaceae bacterium]|nr:c-type cytochrome [Cyclobacteriaceae bacterium]
MTMLQNSRLENTLIIKTSCEKKRDAYKTHEAQKEDLLKKIIPLIIFLFLGVSSFAQDTTGSAKSFSDDPFNHPLLPLYLLSIAIGIVIILVLIAALYTIKILNVFVAQAEKERALKLGIAYKKEPSWWDTLTEKLNASVPVEREESIDLGHNYDGIRELDNHLPPWWKWLFVGTVVWGVIYLLVYHVMGTLPLSDEEYKQEVATAEIAIQKLKAAQPQVLIDGNTIEFTNDAELIANGKKVYLSNCSTCHRNDGGGNAIGPNLTDNYWIHGGNAKSIFNTIKSGVVEKGMPDWGKIMSPIDVRDVTFFVMSLKGSNPVDAKAPQGELFEPVPKKPLPGDTTKTQAVL